MPKKRRMTRRKRKDLILAVVHRSDEPLRILEIARALNMSRSPYLVELISELAEDGELVETIVEVAPDLPARAYHLPAAPRVLRSTPQYIDNHR